MQSTATAWDAFKTKNILKKMAVVFSEISYVTSKQNVLTYIIIIDNSNTYITRKQTCQFEEIRLKISMEGQ